MRAKYVIIGAGPAGLSFAATLKKSGEDSFVVLEKEQEAGGLCRSVICGGAPLDIGGGHVLDTHNKAALDFFFSFLPESEWELYDRSTKIAVGEHSINYPFESNLWQFPTETALDYLESIAAFLAARGQDQPERFMDWIYWNFGSKIAEDYMIPYNSKIWSCDLNELGVYWLDKLPNVSFRDVLRSCIDRAPSGTLPSHSKFYYPKQYGYGEVFLRIAESLKDHIHYGCAVNSIDSETLTVNGEYQAKVIVNTAPWHGFAGSLPADVQAWVSMLKHAAIDIDYHSEPSLDKASHWTYFADIALPYHRIIHRDNIIKGAAGHWTETNALRRTCPGVFHHEIEYAYPLPVLNKPFAIGSILEAMERRNIFGLGRWGEWEHMNSDIAVTRGIALAEKLGKGGAT